VRRRDGVIPEPIDETALWGGHRAEVLGQETGYEKNKKAAISRIGK
jgi:hypothetical protein